METFVGALWRATEARPDLRRAFRAACAPLVLVALWGIAGYTVLGRVSGSERRFVLFAVSPGETFREMFMNALLYVPLGVSLAPLAGVRRTALAGLALSAGVEVWQYVAATGLAQVTDVACNALGCAIGCLPYVDWPSLAERLRR